MTVILLAAGLSERMGSNKLLLPFRGRPLVLSALDAALSFTSSVIVVTGHERERMEEALKGYNVTTVYAPDYRKGQKWSTLAGVEAVSNDDFAVLPGDLPLISADDFSRTAALLEKAGIARASYRGIPGHPVMYRKEHREDLLNYSGTMRAYLKEKGFLQAECSAGCILDADTPESYHKLVEGQWPAL